MTNEATKIKIIHYLIPISALLLFILVMQGGIYRFGPQNVKNDIFIYKKVLKQDIENSHWESAVDNLDSLEIAWGKLIPRIEFHAEKDAIDGIEMSMGRLRGFISAKDKGGSLAELEEINEHLDNLTN